MKWEGLERPRTGRREETPEEGEERGRRRVIQEEAVEQEGGESEGGWEAVMSRQRLS